MVSWGAAAAAAAADLRAGGVDPNLVTLTAAATASAAASTSVGEKMDLQKLSETFDTLGEKINSKVGNAIDEQFGTLDEKLCETFETLGEKMAHAFGTLDEKLTDGQVVGLQGIQEQFDRLGEQIVETMGDKMIAFDKLGARAARKITDEKVGLQAIHDKFDKLGEKMDAFGTLGEKLGEKMDAFDKVGEKLGEKLIAFDKLGEKMDDDEVGLQAIHDKFDKLGEKMDALQTTFDEMQTKHEEREAKIDRLIETIGSLQFGVVGAPGRGLHRGLLARDAPGGVGVGPPGLSLPEKGLSSAPGRSLGGSSSAPGLGSA